MRRRRRLWIAAAVVLVAGAAGCAPGQLAPSPAPTPAGGAATSPAPDTATAPPGTSTPGAAETGAPATPGSGTPASDGAPTSADDGGAAASAPPDPGSPLAPAASAAPAIVAAVRLGAMLPLTGPGAWFGTEIRNGLELAIAEISPAPPRPAGATPGEPSPTGPATTGADRPVTETPADQPTTGPPVEDPAEAGDAPAAEPARPEGGTEEAGPRPAPARPRADPIEPADRPKDVQVALEVADVQPADLRAAQAEFSRLLASGAAAVFTATPTATLAVHPLAAARSVLVVYAGLPTERFPAASRTLVQLRPSAAARGRTLAAYAAARGVRRLAVVAAGDDFGRALRAGVVGEWRRRGAVPVHDESVTLEDPDLRARLRRLVRSGAQAVVTGFRGVAVGELAHALRAAGYTGLLLVADDDRAAILAAGPALGDARLLGDAFVPLPGTRGARFARAYEAKYQRPPSRFAAAAYEAVVLLADGARLAARDGARATGAGVREALVAAGRFPSLHAGDVIVREDGTLARPLALFRVEGGQAVLEGYVAEDGQLTAAPKPAAEPESPAAPKPESPLAPNPESPPAPASP
jgi:ABC-type branched-subunit amino acid transport system substrate-binding protein